MFCHFLGKDAIFQKIKFLRQNIAYVHDIAESQQNLRVSINELERAFHHARSRLTSALAHGLDLSPHQGKQNSLEHDHDQSILDWIKHNVESRKPLTRKDIEKSCTIQVQVSITCGWVNSTVFGYPDEIIQMKRSLQEEQRLQVRRVFLERTVGDLNEYQHKHEHIQGRIAELVLNPAEAGILHLEDPMMRKVMVPARMRTQTMHRGTSRKGKHISVIPYVFDAGKSLTPCMIMSRDSASVQEQLKMHRVRFATNLITKWTGKRSINAEIFLDDISTWFLPHLAGVCRLAAFAEELRVLLMDHCTSNITSNAMNFLTEVRVLIIVFPPHTAQIFQVPVMTRCGALKQHTKYQLRFRGEKVTRTFRMKGYHDFKQTMMEFDASRVFRALEFELDFDRRSEPYLLLFNKEKLRESAGFRELLSRERVARFSWINQAESTDLIHP